MLSQNEIENAYKQVENEYWRKVSKTASALGLFFVPIGGGILDYVVYPQHFEEFIIYRILTTVIIFFVFLLHFTKWGENRFYLLSFIWTIATQAVISYIIFLTDGASSSYYAGLNLTIIGTGLLLPVSIKYMNIFSGVSIAFYITACSLNSEVFFSAVLFNNTYFLLTTCVISAFAVYFIKNRRFEEFKLRFQLDRQNKSLAELDKIKSDFFANISHELRTPLTLILAPLEDLVIQKSHQVETPDSELHKLNIAKKNALKLLQLVNDLLDIIKLEEGFSTLRKDSINISSLVKDHVSSMRLLAEKKSVSIDYVQQGPTAFVEGDFQALEKIFTNLINNAVKFSEAGDSITITLSCVNKFVNISVNDTGIGIPPDELPLIFDRFHQVDSSSTRRHQGTGLGLSLVKELVEKQQGTINVESEFGQGSTFKISFPLASSAKKDAAAEQIEHENKNTAENIHQGLSQDQAIVSNKLTKSYETSLQTDHPQTDVELPLLLIVEDEPDMRQFLMSSLSQDYRIISSANGREGLTLLKTHLPQLVLLDLMLPELDGLQICLQAKQDPEMRQSKIVLLTARIDEEAKLSALNNGADDFLTKPFSTVEIKTRLRNLYETAKLEQDVLNRNRDLSQALKELKSTQTQLLQSEKLNAIGNLSAGLLHEINNPLNYIMTALQIGQNNKLVTQNELLGEILADIDEGVSRIHAIVSDLRAFAYPSEAEYKTVFQISTAIESARNFTAHESKSIKLDLSQIGDFDVVGSQNHIVQVLINLISNSSKALKQKQEIQEQHDEPLIKISTEKDYDKLIVKVYDNGIGISEENLKNIFDPFFTTRDVGEGMGLGLSICHTIISNHGGSLDVESELGEWTLFSFNIPLLTSENAVNTTSTNSDSTNSSKMEL